MRNYMYILFLILLMVGLAACSSSDKKEAATNDQVRDLTLHMLATHHDAELDEYYTELYESIKHIIKENPKMGQPGEFTLQPYRVVENRQGPFYVFLGINRYPHAIENVSFNLTVGDGSDNLIWDEDTILLTKEETGVIPPNSALPILIPITKEMLQKAKEIDFKQLDMSVKGLVYEESGKNK